MGNNPSTPLQTCLSGVAAGRSDFVGYPSNPLFQIQWAKPYNLAAPVTPVAVVRPSTAQDVSALVKCAAASNVKVQAKSGGHSYAYVCPLIRRAG
jgi:FAD/FMN-containing dehydrogenase